MPQQRLINVSRAGVIGSFVVLVVAVVCVRLGVWQLDRLQQRRERNAATQARMSETPVQLTSVMMDSSGLLFRRTRVSGTYDDERTVIIAGRSYHGLPGVYILTPLRVGNSAVLVNRGWMPSADAANTNIDRIREAPAKDVEGLVVELSRDPRPADRDTAATFRRVWFHVNHAALQRAYPYPLANYVVQLLPSADAPVFPKRVDLPEFDEGPHLGYAIQWFSFAIIGIVGWLILLLRPQTLRIVSAAMAALLVCADPAAAQLRPLEPVNFHAFSGPTVHLDIGAGSYSDQRASLAGVRGRLWEVGNFHVTIRTGRMIMEMGGTLQRFFDESEVYAVPFGDATSSTNGKRHDSGDYRVGAVLQLTPGQSSTLATLRFGTRLPTTDNRVGLDRDATDFFATLGARRTFGSFALAAEAGLSINGTRKTTYEQSDVLVYALTGELLLRGVTPYIVALGQEDLHDWVAIRGNEDLGELRIGARAGGRRWINAAFVKGYHEYSPGSGFQLSAGMELGKR